MRISSFSIASILASICLFGLFLTACGDDEPGCENVTCERGVCSPATGKCINLGQCDDNTDCVDGYQCADSGQCEALVTCSSGECERGNCRDGVCKSPDSCQEDVDCAAYDYCSDDGECVSNPCFDKECSAGACDRSTGECISKEVCTAETANQDCVEGEICYNRNCLTADQFCAEIDCERGVCSPEEQRCVNADNCKSNSDCLGSYYCSDKGTCKENVCEDQVRGCRRGVCEPSSGTCVNPDSCEGTSDCLTGHVCVQGQCRPDDAKCGDPGCPGNQVCQYNSTDLTATCIENDGRRCRNALDCVEDRVCDGVSCAEPTSCTPDSFEPNNSSDGEPTVFHDVVDETRSAVDANLCEGDRDVFTFDTERQPELRGTLVVEVEVDDTDVGLGQLQVEVTGPDGQTRQTKKLSRSGQRLRLEVDVSAASRGQYTIEIDAPSRVSPAAIEYSLFADLISQNLSRVCNNARTLQDGRRIQEVTTDGRSRELGSICGGGENLATEQVYKIELEETSFVTFNIAPQETIDIIAGLRRSCERLGSEITCADRAGAGRDENISQTLQPGTYYLVVQGNSKGEGGPVEIFTGIQPSVCTDADNQCLDESTAKICNSRGTGFDERDCQQGCDESRGICQRNESDVCYNAVELAENSTREMNFEQLRGDFSPTLSACLPEDAEADVSGSDAVYEVTVGAEQSLSARLATFPESEASTSLYLSKQCNYPGNTCVKAVTSKSAPHTINYMNRSDSAERLYLYADLPSDSDVESGALEMNLEDIRCEPNSRRCNGRKVEQCNGIGSSFTKVKTCEFSCQNAQCQPPPNDKCSGAFTLQEGNTTSQEISLYSNDNNPGFDGCTGGSTPGPDAVYEFETTSPNQIVSLSLKPEFDGALWVTKGCSNMGANCIAGADSSSSNSEETLRFLAEQPSKYYVVVDSSFLFSQPSGPFELDLEKAQQECTNLNSPISCQEPSNGKLQYCTSLGQKDTYTCGSTCSTGGTDSVPSCDEPTGERCVDPIPLSDGDTVEGDFSGNNNLALPGNSRSGQCFLGTGDRTSGADTVYSVDLSAGQLLEANLSSSRGAAKMYITETCGIPSGCRSLTDGSGTAYYHAETDQRVRIVVDSASSFGSDDYTLGVDIRDASCAPDSAVCTSDSEVQVCNGDGSNVEETYTCADQCRNGACSIQASSINQCSTAESVGDGGYFYGSFGELQNNVEISGQGCTGLAGSGSDATYEVSLQSGDILEAEVTSFDSDVPMLYLLGDCNNPDQNCRKGSRSRDGATAQLTYEATQSETLKLVVDSPLSNASGDYSLHVRKTRPTCSPGQTACGANGQTVKFCNTYGLYENVRCEGSCVGGVCTNPTGESCINSIPLSKTGSIEASWSGVNDSNPGGPEVDGCFFDSNSVPVGPEKVYRVNLSSGDLLTADLDTNHGDAVLYFKEQCGVQTSCQAGRPGTGSQTRQYYAQRTGPVYVVVDSASSSTPSSNFTLDLSVESNRVCNPNQPSCSNISSVELCNESGSQFDTEYSCTGQCIDGACRPNPQTDETCSGATNIGEGLFMYGELADYNNDIEISSSANCIDRTGDGPDLAYNVTVGPDEILDAEAESFGTDNVMVYVLENCSNPNASCQAGASDGGSETARAFYSPSGDQAKTVTVVVDSSRSNATAPFRLSIEKRPPECQTGQKQCAPDGQTLEYCSETGLFKEYECSQSCSNGQCKPQTGEVCVDAISLEDGDSYSGSYSDFSSDLNPGAGANSCIKYRFGGQDGQDAVFSVELEKGELLDAELDTSEFSPGMYVLESCLGRASQECLVGAEDSEQLEFYAPEDGTYYLVVDKGSTFGGDDFTVDVNIDSGKSCQPGGANCVGGSTTDLNVCSADGDSVRYSASCPNRCERGACQPPKTKNDSCSSAYKVDGSTRIVDSFGRFTNKLEPSGQCPVTGATGKDAVYQVDLAAGEFVEASVETAGSFSDISVFMTEDCSGVSSGCLAGQDGGASATAGYLSQSGGTVYVVVENDTQGDAETFTLDLRVGQQECTPGETECGGPGAKQTCLDYGVWESETCYFGCSGGSCRAPTNNTCQNATIVPRNGQTHTYRGPIEEYSNDYNISNAIGRSCTGGSTQGPEALYRIDARRGDIISLSWESDGNSAVWVADDCGDMVNSCVAGVHANTDKQSLEFVAEQNQSYYVAADTDPFGSATGIFEFKATVTPRQCTPGTAACADATTLNYCRPLGDGFSQYSCEGSCVSSGTNASCSTKTGDICADAVDVDGEQSLTVDMSSKTNAFAPQGARCLSTTPSGQDAVYAIDLAADENLDVDVDPQNSGGDPLIYLLKDCLASSDAVNRDCPVGADNNFNGSKETLSYMSTEQQTVYLVVDGSSRSDTTGTWKVDIAKETRTCDPLATSCNANGKLEYCESDGMAYDTYSCSDSCSNGVCTNPTGDVGFEPLPITASGSFTGTFSNYDDDYNPGFGSCVGFGASGSDAVYEVELQSGETIDATLTSTASSKEDTAMYLVRNFLAAEETCVSGDDQFPDKEQVGYRATSDETLYLIVDGASSSVSGDYKLDVTIQ